MIGRRFFLGRAAIGAAAAPALVKQAEKRMLDGVAPSVDSTAIPAPGNRYGSRLGGVGSTDPALKLLREQALEQEKLLRKVDRIRSRTLMAMRSWSPVYMEIHAMRVSEENKSELQKIYDELRNLGGEDAWY